MLNAFITATAAVMVYMIIWFIVSLVIRRNDVADVAWGGGFIVAAAVALLVSDRPAARVILVILLVLIWGIRLALHIGLRNRGKKEDARYRKWREECGKHVVLRSLFRGGPDVITLGYDRNDARENADALSAHDHEGDSGHLLAGLAALDQRREVL